MAVECVVLVVLAAIGWTGFLLELRRHHTPRARHVPARTAETRARAEMREAETRKVKEVADLLDTQAKQQGQKFSRKELEAEARRLLMGAGASRIQ